MSKYKNGWMDFEEASYLSDLFQQIVTDCRVSFVLSADIKLSSFSLNDNKSHLALCLIICVAVSHGPKGKIPFILLLRNICVCLSLKSKKFLILYTKNVKTKSKICRIILIWHRLQVIRKEVALLIYNFYIQISLQHISLWNILV